MDATLLDKADHGVALLGDQTPIDIIQGDGDTVTFRVKQLWKSGDTISWLSIDHRVVDGDVNTETYSCPKLGSVRFGTVGEYTAECVGGSAVVTLYAHDGQFPRDPDITSSIPGRCSPSNDKGKKIMYKYSLPCSSNCEAPCTDKQLTFNSASYPGDKTQTQDVQVSSVSDGTGSVVRFDFPALVDPKKIIAVVSGSQSPPEVVVYYGNDQKTVYTMSPNGAGVGELTILENNAYWVQIKFHGSGYVASLSWNDCDVQPPQDPPPNEICVPETVDFSDLQTGAYVGDLSSEFGIMISASSDTGYTPGGQARIFDTRYPTGDSGQTLCQGNDGNAGLGAPNFMCSGGGPGIGDGGEPGQPTENCGDVGKVLIIQKDNSPCPVDNLDGGTITMEFVDELYRRRAISLHETRISRGETRAAA